MSSWYLKKTPIINQVLSGPRILIQVGCAALAEVCSVMFSLCVCLYFSSWRKSGTSALCPVWRNSTCPVTPFASSQTTEPKSWPSLGIVQQRCATKTYHTLLFLLCYYCFGTHNFFFFHSFLTALTTIHLHHPLHHSACLSILHVFIFVLILYFFLCF